MCLAAWGFDVFGASAQGAERHRCCGGHGREPSVGGEPGRGRLMACIGRAWDGLPVRYMVQCWAPVIVVNCGAVSGVASAVNVTLYLRLPALQPIAAISLTLLA